MNYLQSYHGLGGNVKKSCKVGLERGAKKIQKNAKYLAPEGKTGRLRNSIKTKSEETQDEVKAQVFTNAEESPYVEFGTGQKGLKEDINGNPINHTAKEKWVYTPDGGKTFYTTSGQAAQPFLSPAFLHAKNTGEVEQEVTKSIQQDIRKLGGKK